MSQIFQKLAAALGNVTPDHQQSEAARAVSASTGPTALTQQELLLVCGATDDPYAGPRGGWLA